MLSPAVYWRWKWALRFLQMCWFLPSWKWCWRWWRPWQFLCLSPQSSSAVPSCLKRQINIGFKGGMMCLWNSGTLSDCPPLMIPALGVRDLHSCSMAFYWNSLLWISSLLFFCLQIHHFNIWESSICSSSTRAFHFLQRNKQCLVLQALTFQDFP